MALRVPISWLYDFVEPSATPEELAERLTLAGLEVESLINLGAQWNRDVLRVGRISEVAAHPNADRLCLVTVDYGAAAPITVVTGAPNMLRHLGEQLPAEPLMVPLALVGAELIDGHAGDGRKLKLKAGNIRGVRSEGMVCSERELGLSEDHEGILIFPSDAPLGAALADYLGDHVLEFDIKGGFAHLLSVFGVAREAAVLTGKTLKRGVLEIAQQEHMPTTGDPSYIQLEIADPDLCSRYVALLIEGITVCPSPFWMSQRLLRAGLRPINAIVDVTNYVMLELGQPLHAFDYGILRPEGQAHKPLIRVRRAQPGEKMRTLDGVERSFDGEMLLITDGGGAVGLAGVMGGENSEITDDTTAVLLESANFEFLNTRRTSQLLKLRTEASDRFGKRLDPELCLRAALRAATLIAEICGGRLRVEYGDLYPQPAGLEPVRLELEFVERLLGVAVPREEVVRTLEALEFTVTGEDPLLVTPPSHRMDVSMPADLVEEVGRIHGYDRMPHTLIQDELPPQMRNTLLDGTERIRDLLIGCGLDEIITYSIVSIGDQAKLDPGGGAVDESAFLAVKNPLSAERGHLRRGLLAEGLNTMRANLRFQGRVSIFEVGRVFHPRAGEMLPEEPLRLCALLSGPRAAEFWQSGESGPAFEFYDVKGVAETLLEGLEQAGAEWRPGAGPAYHPGRSAQLLVEGKAVGELGELHPRVVAAFGLGSRTVCALEADVDALLALWHEDKQMDPLSQQPPVYEDLAFIVDEALPAEQLRAMIAQTGGPLLREVQLFDLYRDQRLGAGKKSLAYALTYQAEERTLTDGEVAKVRSKIVKRVEKELGAELRGEV
ncbi:MAG: phenylalanine--tRNA ligase subunit beta [SAR324 cluster bacterium]|nr:phenylalanine--tRNA ligase subunit beta [SAR324 cluster bacterium]